MALRTSGIEVTPALSEHVHGQLRRRLAKHSSQVERLSVRFEDIDGPRRREGTICRIRVVLSGLPSIVVQELASDALQAFNLADHRVERAVVRAVSRARPARVLQARGDESRAKRPRPTRRLTSPRARASRSMDKVARA